MIALKTSGDRATWLNRVANHIMDGGSKPPSMDTLYKFVPLNIVTGRNDGHVTAAENLGENHRDDYKAGQKIIIDEMVGILRKQGFVGNDDEALRWLKPLDGEWKVKIGDKLVTVRGQQQRRMSRERHILGDWSDKNSLERGPLGLIEMGQSAGFDVDIIGDRGAVRRETLMVHPYAFLVPPMSEREREGFRKDVEENGVQIPLVLYPDATDINPNSGKPRLKVLDGRHRLYYAAQLKKPVRVEVLNADDKTALKRIVSLNIKRRHLSITQETLMARRMFEGEARKEAKEAYLENVGRPEKEAEQSPPFSKEISKPKHAPDWAERVVQKAHEIGLTAVTTYGVRNIEPVMQAPETLARVERGELGKVAFAHRAASQELGQPPAPRGQDGSLVILPFDRLGKALVHIDVLCLNPGPPFGYATAADMLARLDEMEMKLRKIRDAIRMGEREDGA